MPPKPHRRWRWPWARFLTKKSLATADEALPFTDDILAEILIRLPTLEDLGRACASCRAFRRIITSDYFLRRLHALRPPSLLGFHSLYSPFHPAQPPHPSAPAARAVAAAADFNFSFLPTRGRDWWRVRDARDGRFLLVCLEGTDPTHARIAVCDPLFRRYQLLPPLPEDLATAGRQMLKGNGKRRYDVFLAPCIEEEVGRAQGAFSVIWMAQCPIELIAFIFSSASGQWRTIASRSWHDLYPTVSPFVESPLLLWRSYAYGCFYWYLSGVHFCSKLIVLDIGRMEFYPVNYPSNHNVKKVDIVELGESRRGMLVLSKEYHPHNQDYDVYVVRLYSASSQIQGEGATEWVLDNTVTLYGSSNFTVIGVADGMLLLQGIRERKRNSEEEYGCISLNLKTGLIQRKNGLIQRFRWIIPKGCTVTLAQYIGYPPSLSLPTI